MELRNATMKKKEKEKRRKEKMEEFNLNDQSVEKNIGRGKPTWKHKRPL